MIKKKIFFYFTKLQSAFRLPTTFNLLLTWKNDVLLTQAYSPGLFPGKSAATVFNNKTELFERPTARIHWFLGY